MSATGNGNALWRSLGELAGGEEFRRHVENEFPAFAQLIDEGVDRRTLLKVMGATLALGGLAACSEAEEIVPYVRQPENTVPGRPRFYATTLASDGYGIGALVESHEGRPTKVEGNPDHPASRGASDAIMQASVLTLFDPDRSHLPLHGGEPASKDDVLGLLAGLGADHVAGAGLAILLEPTTSPTLTAQLERLKASNPELAIYTHDPLGGTGSIDAVRSMTGRALTPLYRFSQADAIVSLDSDFLGEGPGRLAYAADFSQKRRVRAPSDTMSRLYAVESMPTVTGAVADHRRAARPAELEDIAAALAARLSVNGAGKVDGENHWLDVAADDLARAGAKGLVIAGDHQGAFVHAAALAINERLGAVGTTVEFIEPPARIDHDGDLADLCAAIKDGQVGTLLILGSNPAHTGSADLNVASCFRQLSRLIHWGLYRDETAALANWHIPAAHELESWSDLRSHDGTASIVQPLIRPLYGGMTVHEILAGLDGSFDLSAQDIVRGHWAKRLDDRNWRQALKDGVIAGTAAKPVTISFGGLEGMEPVKDGGEGMSLRLVPDPFLRDGRHANAAWLQELPRPLTKLVWGNAALVSPATAAKLAVENRQAVILKRQGYSLDAAIWIVPGHADNTVTLALGHGREKAGHVAALASGSNAFHLRTREARWFAADLDVVPVDEQRRVLTTQHHQAMEGRDIVRHASLHDFRSNPDFVRDGAPPPPDETVYGEWDYPREAWGMSIDQSACIGCMACVAACQAENNIATVGPDECERGHEMHWLRVDRYYEGPPEEPETFFQPVPCMQCEKAPCEVVCPVNATVHTHDGLNAQIYNRCIGTRYCSQNCPYKVRRFNFREYQPFDKGEAGPEQARRNPDVSVRSRGVMEKCTYCVQRISAARIEAQIDNREIEDGAVVTACQQACPTRAISFGDINRKDAQVTADKSAPHDYALLAELNTRPRTTYLGRISNPNPKLKKDSGRKGGDD